MAHFGKDMPQKNKNNALYLYGRHPVTAAINNPKRQISALYVTKETYQEAVGLCNKAQRSPTLIKQLDRKEIEKLLPTEAVHQGFAAAVKELETCINISNTIRKV